MRLAILLLLVLALAACGAPGDEPTAEPVPTATVTTAALPTVAPTLAPSATATSTSLPTVPTATVEPATPNEPADPPTAEPTKADLPAEPGSGGQSLLPEGVAIVFSQSGGIAGMMQTVTVYADGRIVETESGATSQVSPDQVTALLASIEQTGFFDLVPPKPAENVCCDFFFFSLTAEYGELSNAVALSDGDPNMPESFRLAVSAVQTFLRENGPAR